MMEESSDEEEEDVDEAGLRRAPAAGRRCGL